MKKTHLLIAAAIALPPGIYAQDTEIAPVPPPVSVEKIIETKQTPGLSQRETTNPDAEALADNPDATEVRDTSPKADMNSKKLEDSIDVKANPNSESVQNNSDATAVTNSQPLANPDSNELKDTGKMANPNAQPTDQNTDATALNDSDPKTNPDAEPVQANPDSKPLKNTSKMANPDAKPVPDTNEEANTESASTVPAPPKVSMAREQASTTSEPGTEVPTNIDTPANKTKGEARATMRAQAKSREPEKVKTTLSPPVQPQAQPAAPRPKPTEAAVTVLSDNATPDRTVAAEQARKIENDDDAGTLIKSILGGAAAGAIAAKIATSNKNRVPDQNQRYRRGERLPLEEVGRTQRDRDQSVDYFVRRFNGNAAPREAPHYQNQQNRRTRPPVFYEGNRRVVRYASREEIPPVLIGYDQLQRVELAPVNQFGYAALSRERVEMNRAPVAYHNDNAYAVSYKVDPNSAVSRDDILFRQGETAFADAYSYDLVIDLAEALRSSALQNQRFVIEGHASAEGDYSQNLRLSQDRAERIARDLVSYGVNPDRLVPVGYGEAEANYASESSESLRRLDRRVMVFRLEE